MIEKRHWSIIALLLVITAIVLYLNSQRELLVALGNVTFSAIAYLIVLRLLFLFSNGLFLREFASKFDVHLLLKEWFGLSVVTTMGNYLTPFSGGMVARAAYLKHRHAFPYAQFLTLLAANYLITFWTVGIAGVLTLLSFGKAIQDYWHLIVFFGVVVASISTMMMFPVMRLPWKNRVTRIINTSLNGWRLVRNDRSLQAKLVAYTVVNIVLNGISFWVAYRALGYSVSFRSALVMGLLTSFSILINVTPGNLGIQEAVAGLSSELLGMGTGEGLLAALLIRAATLIPVFALGPLFSYILTRKMMPYQSIATANTMRAKQAGDVDVNLEDV